MPLILTETVGLEHPLTVMFGPTPDPPFALGAGPLDDGVGARDGLADEGVG